jgi:hypothetical protein
MVDQLRVFVVAFIITGAYSLTFGSNLIIGILAQMIWMVTQIDMCHHMNLTDARNILIQFLFLVILLAELKNYIKTCKKEQAKQTNSPSQNTKQE